MATIAIVPARVSTKTVGAWCKIRQSLVTEIAIQTQTTRTIHMPATGMEVTAVKRRALMGSRMSVASLDGTASKVMSVQDSSTPAQHAFATVMARPMTILAALASQIKPIATERLA